MFDRYMTKGSADALRRFGFTKEANQLELPHITPAPAVPAAAPAAAAGGGWGAKAKAFGQDQWGAAKSLAGNLRQGLGGAPDAAAGTAARGAAVGNLKTLAPSLAAGGALYMLHHHHQAKQEEEERRRAMMMGGGYPAM